MRTHNEKIFHIPKVPQYGIIVESPEQVNESIFYEVYQNAAKCVANILASNRLPAHSFPKEKFFNTVISFTGTRGSGKSSAMLTFGNLLKCNNEKIWRQMEIDSDDILKSRFWVLPAIDCTRMGANEKLLASVSAKMYQEYQKQSADGKFSYGVTVDQRRNFLTNAQKVNKLAYMFSAGSWYKDESDILQSVADLENIDHSIHELVRSFLSLMFTTQDENSYLVIQIDDLDMNLENSYEIVDEIRKFLMIKNVIVLTSVCMDQLKEVTGLYFNKPLAGKQSGYSNTGDVLAQKYLEKVFPISRQISMPALTTEQLNNYKISNLLGFCDKRAPTSRTELGLDDIAEVPSKMTIFNGVLHLIYRKTLLLLVPERSGRHWIVPNNLRELCNFIYLLQGMNDIAYKKNEEKYQLRTNAELQEPDVVHTLENNLHSLMMYIVSDMLDYSTAHMHEDTQVMAGVLMRIIHDLPEWTLTTMNKRIVRDILVCAQKTPAYKNFYNEDSQNALIKASAYNYIISMGDVQYVLNVLHKGTNNHTIKRFVEYIRVIWSIRMTLEFFCVGVKNYATTEDSNKYKEYYESSSLYITKNFRDAVGGMMVNPDMTYFWNRYSIDGGTLQTGSNAERDDIYKDWRYIKDTEIQHDSKSVNMFRGIAVFGTNGEIAPQNIRDWRTIAYSAQYYKFKFSKLISVLYMHPMAIFTNLLAPVFLIPEGADNNSNVIEWQEKNIMVFPFFSLDWVNRFYSELEKIFKENPSSNKKFFNDINSVLETINSVTKYFINESKSEMRDGDVLLAEHSYLDRLTALKETVREFDSALVGSNEDEEKTLPDENEKVKMIKMFKDGISALITNLEDEQAFSDISAKVFSIMTTCTFDSDTAKFVADELEQVEDTEECKKIENEKDRAEYILEQLIEEKFLEKLQKNLKSPILSQANSTGQ